MQQMTFIGTKHDPHATEQVDIAIADFIFSNGLPISLVECTKFHKLIQSVRHIPANVVHALTTLMYSKANRKHDIAIAVQKNNLHEEVEQQQDHVLAARIDR